MRHLATFTKYSNVLDRGTDSKKYQVNPGFIVGVEELAADSSKNLGVRTRLDVAMPNMGTYSVLVWESSDEIDAEVERARTRMRQQMTASQQATEPQS